MSEQKQRHGCLTAWLVMMIVLNSILVLLFLLFGTVLNQALSQGPAWALPVRGLIGLFNVVCAIALLSWKRWGFWGVLASTILAFVFNLSTGIGIGSSLIGLIGIAALYGVLHIGNENKGWPQLD